MASWLLNLRFATYCSLSVTARQLLDQHVDPRAGHHDVLHLLHRVLVQTARRHAQGRFDAGAPPRRRDERERAGEMPRFATTTHCLRRTTHSQWYFFVPTILVAFFNGQYYAQRVIGNYYIRKAQDYQKRGIRTVDLHTS